MRPSGDLKQSSSQSFRPKRISERFLIRLPGLPAYINSFHLNGSDAHPGDGFGNHVWLSLGIGERTESQPAMLHAAEATPWIHLSARQKKKGHGAIPSTSEHPNTSSIVPGRAATELLTQEGAQNQQPAEFKTMSSYID